MLRTRTKRWTSTAEHNDHHQRRHPWWWM